MASHRGFVWSQRATAQSGALAAALT